MAIAYSVDWGSVPQWIGGLLSGLSVLLALFIIVRDKHRDERSQARQIGFTTVTEYLESDAIHRAKLRVWIHNTSGMPIYSPSVRVESTRKSDDYSDEQHFDIPGLPRNGPALLGAGENAVTLIYVDRHPGDLYVCGAFADQRGVGWQRDLQNNRLRKLRW